MNRLLLFIFIFFSFPIWSNAQPGNVPVTYISDTLPRQLDTNWLFTTQDDTSFVSPFYDDSKWKVINDPELRTNLTKKKYYVFEGKGWLRLHLYADSSVSDDILSLQIKHFGASELYLDGKQVAKFGTIKDKNGSEYENPLAVPITVNLKPGHHVVAIRYANYDAQHNLKFFNEENAGVRISINKAQGEIYDLAMTNTMETFLAVFISSFFIAFFLLHLILFIYNRKEIANLYFSIFCLSFGLIFISQYIIANIPYPLPQLAIYHVLMIAVAAMCMSLSGFLNELFGSKKLRFTIIALLCLLSVVVWFFYDQGGALIGFLVIGIVCIEAMFLIIRAMVRRIKGAFIVGIGILFLTATYFSVIVIGVSSSDGVNLGMTWGILTIFAFLSIPTSMSVYLSWNYAHINKSLAEQLQRVEALSEKTMQQEMEKQRLLENRQDELEQEVEMRTAEIKNEKKKSDDLLRNILPEEVAEELKQKGSSDAKYFDDVSVIFTDFVNFTKAGERMTPQELVDELHTCFKAFDEICSKYNIEKIKTIGDAYLAVCGLPVTDANHAIHTTRAALEIRSFIAARHQQMPDKTFNIRIGIHSGPVVAGIVGVKKFAYDIWGDTVNTAARMEQHGEPGKINISENTHELVKAQFTCTFRGQITAKNKGEMNMYFVEGEQ